MQKDEFEGTDVSNFRPVEKNSVVFMPSIY